MTYYFFFLWNWSVNQSAPPLPTLFEVFSLHFFIWKSFIAFIRLENESGPFDKVTKIRRETCCRRRSTSTLPDRLQFHRRWGRYRDGVWMAWWNFEEMKKKMQLFFKKKLIKKIKYWIITKLLDINCHFDSYFYHINLTEFLHNTIKDILFLKTVYSWQKNLAINIIIEDAHHRICGQYIVVILYFYLNFSN